MIGLPRAAERRLAISLVIALVALIPAGSVQAREGGQIVFQSRIDDNTDIYVMDGDGTNVRRLTDAPEGDGSPRWSPGGARMFLLHFII